jgi:hypothetical protein
VVIIMFSVDLERKRVVIAHRVQASDGHVDLTTTFNLSGVPEDKVLLWAATNRMTRWLAGLDIGRLSSAEVKKRFDNLAIEYTEYFRSNTEPISQEEKIVIDNLHKVLGKGASMENVLQALIRSALQFGR